MANYNLYKNISPGSITAATASLRQSLNPAKTKLGTFQTSLNDKIWKAKSKETLLTAFKTINSDVYTEVETALSNLDTAAGYISTYIAARNQALQIKSQISSAPADSDKSALYSALEVQEGIMDDSESNVNSLL